MLTFRKLRLTGFKSFVEPTDLPIDRGLTGVVGPNGCGKSNLVEALRWAMGETSAKRMRGGGMDDIIFAGSGARPRRDFAEVAIFLDNPARDIPGPFNTYDELVVSRSITRDSGTAYRINGTEVRARDVGTLFADSATGSQSPSIVRQGRISEIISAKPIERRRFLEEAAGISGLHARRKDAEIKLRAARNNLTRLEEVLRTIDSQHRALQHQAKEAARYNDLARELREAEAMLLHLEWRAAQEAYKDAEKQLTDLAEAARQSAVLTDQAATAQAAAATHLPRLRQESLEASGAFERTEGERQALGQEVEQAEMSLAMAERRLQQISEDSARIAEQRQDAEKARRSILGESESESQASAGDEAAQAEVARQAQQDLQQAEALLRDGRKALEAAMVEVTRAEAASEALAAQRAETQARLAELEEQKAEDQKDSQKDTLKDTPAKDGESSTPVLEEIRATEKQVQEQYLAAQAEAVAAERAAHSLERKRAATAAEVRALERTLLNQKSELWPSLRSEIQVEKGYERALAAALGDDLMASRKAGAPLFWNDLADKETSGGAEPEKSAAEVLAQSLIRFAPRKEEPKAAPVESSPQGAKGAFALPAGVRPLSDFVRAPQVLARRLAQIGLVDSAEQGATLQPRLLAGQCLVSREGGLWRWDGLTASDSTVLPQARRLEQHRRLREQREAMTTLASEAEAALADSKAKAEAAQALEEKAAHARRQLDAAWLRQESLRAEAARRAEAQELEQTQSRLIQEQDQTDKRLAELRQGREAAEKTLAEAQESVTTARAAEQEATAEILLQERRKAERAQELRDWERRLAEIQEHETILESRRTENEEEKRRLAEAPTDLRRRSRALEERLEGMRTRRDEAAAALAAAESRHRELSEALRAAELRQQENREAQIRGEGVLEQHAERVANVATRADERLALTVEELVKAAGWNEAEGKPLPDADSVRRRFESLQNERERLGPVNLRAESEIGELSEKLQTMGGERDELSEGIDRLHTGIQTLNREGRRRLLEAFTQVNDNFTSLFQRLFGGGEASLKLIESEDPLQAGLEILASPPGKRLQSLSLLSGGEQSLTALALLFAVFLTNPAPICVLDEVDAPLDDINVHRFCDLVEELAKRSETRFLIVTHHRHTMARMDRLFGVTMPERGVSRLVSVDLARAEQLRETA